MKITSARFALSSTSIQDCPIAELPEFAFIGRSNVGKSSLLNMLCNQKALARVSQKPGHTATINFYVINEEMCFVDLPGYGYAKAPKSERNRFNDFVADYLEFREGLQQVFVLIDSRHDPQAIDINFVTWLVECEIPFSLVFTKSDKSKPGRVKAKRDLFLEKLGEFIEGEPPTFITSSESKDGRLELLRFVRELAGE
ncbi:MAG: YihA family ribosome biogenesis GTP-binding protein [Verrucomicrobiales bacterium]|nr:YihA family ribosome biogenesis GTP-binding protein [Verrucomicrobiales bacterium]